MTKLRLSIMSESPKSVLATPSHKEENSQMTGSGTAAFSAAESNAVNNASPSPKRASIVKVIQAALLMGLMAALSGCVTLALRDTSGPMAPTSDEESFAEFMDVPYPATMTLEKDATFSYTRREVKAGVVTVIGKMTVDEIGYFYDTHLPGHGWSPVAEAQSLKLVSTWTKGGKVLTIIATPIVMAIGGNLRLELWVGAPHTKGDLGQRTVYQSTGGDKGPLVETKPIRRGKNNNIEEEDL